MLENTTGGLHQYLTTDPFQIGTLHVRYTYLSIRKNIVQENLRFTQTLEYLSNLERELLPVYVTFEHFDLCSSNFC